jgi:hypothetical protein
MTRHVATLAWVAVSLASVVAYVYWAAGQVTV